jgi:hypothetical protein
MNQGETNLDDGQSNPLSSLGIQVETLGAKGKRRQISGALEAQKNERKTHP